MLISIFAIFLILHGLVHLLYFCQSQSIFQLQPKLKWPENAWLFTRFFSNGFTRAMASLFCLLSAISFSAGGVALILKLEWWLPATVISAVFSTLLYVLFWDGDSDRLKEKGAIGILINLMLLFLVVFMHWPVV